MSISRRTSRAFVPILAGLLASLALLPAVAQAQHRSGAASAARYGSTALVLDPAAANALSSLGVSPGLIAPAYQSGGALRFPITNPVASALLTGTVKHAGGISLTKGATEVDLTNFWINLRTRQLSAVVNGGARIPILNLGSEGARVSLRHGRLVVGPVTASLTSAAAGALNNAFGVTAFTEGLVLGKATVRYSSSRGTGGELTSSTSAGRAEPSPPALCARKGGVSGVGGAADCHHRGCDPCQASSCERQAVCLAPPGPEAGTRPSTPGPCGGGAHQ